MNERCSAKAASFRHLNWRIKKVKVKTQRAKKACCVGKSKGNNSLDRDDRAGHGDNAALIAVLYSLHVYTLRSAEFVYDYKH